MLIDFNQHPDIGLDCDVCIVGSGAAGSVLFDMLSKARLKVILLESGGLVSASETQKLNEGFLRLNGRPAKEDYTSLVSYRQRSLGGTTNLWAGGCEPFEEVDFASRSWVKDSGWPIELAELEAFYGEAKRYVDITANVFDERLWSVLGIQSPYKFNPDEITTSFAVRSGFLADHGYLNWPGPVKFGRYLNSPEAVKSNSIVLYNATLTDLNSDGHGAVRFGEICNAKFDRRKVRAKIYILTAGGWENPRIMLNANRGVGIGNETDCVGRYYLGHPYGHPAELICLNKAVATELFWKFQYYKVGNNRAQAYFTFKRAAQERYQLLSSTIYLTGNYDEDSAVRKAMLLRDQIKYGGISSAKISLSDMAILLSDLDDVLANAYRSLSTSGVHARMMEKIELNLVQEGTPKRDSRIYLSKEKDIFGVNKLVLDWHFDEQEIESIYRAYKLFAATARQFGWGRVQFHPEADVNSDNPTRGLEEGAHPSGATRMSNDRKRGVVDRNLRVHSTKNLYVCGSSVFPTNSWVSPTFTIVALAVRLAKHLKELKT